MSMFGAFMSDIEEDPFFGPHMRSMRQMNNMIHDMFPFSLMGNMNTPPFATAHQSLMPFGFPGSNMNGIFPEFCLGGGRRVQQGDPLQISYMNEGLGRNDPNVHTYSSSSVVAMSHGADGQPEVFQAATTSRSAPGGIKETKKLMSDTRSGVKKIAVGHHIGERSHVLEQEHNYRSGESEQRQDFINIDEDEAEDFNREFEEKARQSAFVGRASRPGRRLLSRALLNDSTSTKSRRSCPALPASSSSSLADESDLPQSRKRDHEPCSERSSKALKPSHETSM